MIAIIDYGVGNLFSLRCSFKYIGEEAVVTSDIGTIEKSDRVVLPGVGAFGDAARLLRDSGLDIVVKRQAEEKPFLGICLGMQLLFEKSYEYGEHEGLSLIPGEVIWMKPLLPEEAKLPHIGWNRLIFPKEKGKSRLFKYIGEDHVYFVHSFMASCGSDAVSAYTEYNIPVTAAVEKGNVFGVQFHPEKSSSTGLKILKAFCEI